MREKIAIRQVILVEGRYDAAKLANLVDGLILTTGGFDIYRDKKKQALLKKLGREQGILLLTDPDAAGFQIRNFITNLVGEAYVRQAYIPAVQGKEPRKAAPGKEGLLGVEGLTDDAIRAALLLAGTDAPKDAEGEKITYADLFTWGISGTADSAARRRAFLQAAGLPLRLSKKALLEVLNRLFTRQQAAQLAASVTQAAEETLP